MLYGVNCPNESALPGLESEWGSELDHCPIHSVVELVLSQSHWR